MSTEIIESNIEIGSELVVTKTIIGQADDLALEHEDFNDRYIVTGRLALYELIGKIYALFGQLESSIDKEEQIKMLKDLLFKKFGIRTQDNTSDTTVLVRYITRADRKTSHIYSRAIETARFHNIKPENFVKFLQDHGGLERLRAIGVDSESIDAAKDLEDEKIDLTWKYLSARGYDPFVSFDEPRQFKDIQNKNCAYEYVICYRGMDRKYHVIGKMPAKTELENYLVKYLSRYLCDDIELARKGIGRLVIEAEKKRAVLDAVYEARQEWKKEIEYKERMNIENYVNSAEHNIQDEVIK